MEYAEMTEARLSVLEARMAFLKQRLVTLEQGSAVKPRRKKELTPEERQAIRARLLAGQQAKREREAAAAAEVEEADRKKGTKNGAPEAAN